VNVAARLPGEAEAGEIVLPEDLAESVMSSGSLREAVIVERFTATLKSIEHPLRLVRARTSTAVNEERKAVV